MRILVLDDSKKHLAAAEETLAGHELTLVDSYGEAFRLLAPGAPFDAVLSDLLMPAEADTLGPEGMKFFGHQMPIGLVMVFAAVQAGVKRVAVITDANHHNHPMSAALDILGRVWWDNDVVQTFKIDGASVIIAHAPLLPDGRKDWAKAFKAVCADVVSDKTK